jgi:hypothetical protein
MRAEQHVVRAGVAHWRESLSQISTIYTDAKHAADVEEKVGFGNFKFSCIFLSKHQSMQVLNVAVHWSTCSPLGTSSAEARLDTSWV